MVHLERKESVAWVHLDSPSDYNAFSLELATEFFKVIKTVVSEKNIDVVVIQGKGHLFSSGANIKKMDEALNKRVFFDQLSSQIYESFFAIRDSSQIFVAAVHGKVIGVALPLILCCDLIWARKGTEFIPGYLNIGLFPNGGLTYLLPEYLGSKRAFELLFFKQILSAEEALRCGLISDVVEDFEKQIPDRIEQFCRGPVQICRKTKELISLQRRESFKSHMAKEKIALLESSEGIDFIKGLQKARHKT